MNKKEKVRLVLERLYKVYPHPKTALIYKNPFELLISTILSAQATDKSVNIATPELFKNYPTPDKMSKATPEELDKYLLIINFHQNKAKLIRNCSLMLMEKFNGIVPDNMEDLDSLPGVARKTANVILGNAFKKAEGIVVDTHVMRLSKKLGFTKNTDPVKIEQDLIKIVPLKNWIDFSHLLINHGRDICTARPHNCDGCPLADMCPCKEK